MSSIVDKITTDWQERQQELLAELAAARKNRDAAGEAAARQALADLDHKHLGGDLLNYTR